MKNGENVFITGNAGTGKSFVVNTYRYYCRMEEIDIAATAPTGIAALNIEGQTLHSFFRIPLGLDGTLKHMQPQDFDDFEKGTVNGRKDPNSKNGKTGTEKVFKMLMNISG